MSNNKEIIVLSDAEHVIGRPTMYVGSIEPAEERIPIIKGGRIHIENQEISIGFYKMFHEVLDNAIDEAKRMKGKMPSVRVDINSETGQVIVIQGMDFSMVNRKIESPVRPILKLQ